MINHLKKATPTEVDANRDTAVKETVAKVISDVATRGDEAVREYSAKFDNWSPESFALGADEIERIVARVPEQALEDIRAVQARVRDFAQRQRDAILDFEAETEPGVFLGQRNIPVAAAGA